VQPLLEQLDVHHGGEFPARGPNVPSSFGTCGSASTIASTFNGHQLCDECRYNLMMPFGAAMHYAKYCVGFGQWMKQAERCTPSAYPEKTDSQDAR
jgi:hypothetical protein